MRVGSRHLGWLFWSAVMVLAPSAARADFLTPPQTRFAPLRDTDFSLATPLDAMGNPTPFNKFVPSAGTALHSVNIDIKWRIDSTINLQFTTPATLTVLSSGTLSILGPDGKPLPGLINPAFTNNVVQFEPGPAKVPFPTKINSGEIVLTITDPAELALFTSKGPSDLTFNIPIHAFAGS